MKRFRQNDLNCHLNEQNPQKKIAMDLANANEKKAATKFLPQRVQVNASGDAAYSLNSLPKDMIHLGGENFVKVVGFLGQTRVHIRRHVCDEEGFFHPTKDGISLSPMVWLSFCSETNAIINHRSPDKVFVIDKDLCVSKQKKDDAQLFVFQRLFQRKNLSMQFVPEHIVLKESEMDKLCEVKKFITECVKDTLITYTLFNNIINEIYSINHLMQPSKECEGFLQLIESLGKCLCDSVTLKITELVNCFGCRDNYQASFMHDCRNRAENFSEFFDKALFQVNMKDVARDIVQKNLNVDYEFVLGQQEFFDSVDTTGLFKSIEKMYISADEEKDEFDDLIQFFCN